MEFHPFSELEKKLSPEVREKAYKLFVQESFKINLKMLREKNGKKQEQIENFSQTAVSKLERRKDIKISTLIDYLDSLGFGLEIAALPKGNNAEREILLRI